MSMLKGDRVVLTEAGRTRFPDIGTRAGTVIAPGGQSTLVEWDGRDFRSLLFSEYLEPLHAGQ